MLRFMIEDDAHRLAESLRCDFPSPRAPQAGARSLTTAAKIIDCVLSLRKHYNAVVVPRVTGFMKQNPQTRTCEDLRILVGTYATPVDFMNLCLRMNSPKKADMIVGIVEHLLDAQRRFDGPTEEERLAQWATFMRPTDYLLLDVPNFKLAGFQYLRMHFGADTLKPDVYILKYVERCLGRPITGRPAREVQAVFALERACTLLGRTARSVDTSIWEAGTGQSLPS